MSSTAEIAHDMLTLFKAGQFAEVGAKYWADDVVSREPMDGPMAVIQGRKAVEEKGAWWYANHEVHSATADGPFVQGDQVAFVFALDVTAKQSGQRMQMREVGLYTLKDGKIAEEKFLYGIG